MREFNLGSHNMNHTWDTFLNTPPGLYVSPAVTLIPVPYDGTTSYRTGSRYGPKAIITASSQLEDYDLELERDVSKAGIQTLAGIEPNVSGPERMIETIDQSVSSALNKNNIVGLIGGEHTLTVGAVRAYRRHYPSLSVLYLDAHADLRNEYQGSQFSHACVARRVLEMCPVVQAGVRSLSEEERQFIDDQDIPVFYWQTQDTNVSVISPAIIDKLSDYVYVSIDLDVLDPSIMAAVGTPEPGGMSWDAITSLLRLLSKSKRIVGFDVVELSPEEGPEACSFIASKLIYKLIGYATSTEVK